MIDLPELFIDEGKVWDVYIDLYVLNYHGNLFDAGTPAAMTALYNAHAEIRGREGDKGRDCKELKTDSMVSSTTFAKIGNRIMIDPTKNEQEATMQGDHSHRRKQHKGDKRARSGSFSVKEVSELVEESFKKHKELKGPTIVD